MCSSDLNAYQNNQLSDEEFFADIYHPTSYGHQIMADSLMSLFKTFAKAKKQQEVIELPTTSCLDHSFDELVFVTAQSYHDAIITPGGFDGTDSEVQTFARTTISSFPDNFHHTSDNGTASFIMEVECKNMIMNYKLSSNTKFGMVEIYLDGELIQSANGYVNGGWNNSELLLLLDEKESAKHILEIKMAAGEEDKKFTILALGYSP